MANKKELKTIENLKKLNAVIGDDSTKEDLLKSKSPKGPRNTFKTSEVVVIVVITIIISLILGGVFSYKLFGTYNGTRVESELQEFINNYHYIINNYNGEIDKEELLDAAIEGMLNKLDKNSTYLDAQASDNFNIYLEGSYDGLGIEVYNNEDGGITINQVFKNSPAAKAKLKAGDIIIKLNGQSVQNMSTAKFKKKIKQCEGEITITYLRDGEQKSTKLSLDQVNLESVSSKTFNQSGKKIGYIYINIFASNTYEQFKEKFENLQAENIDALIIDLRSNSGGYLSVAENIISLFLDSSHPIFQIQKGNKTTKYYSKGQETLTLDIAVLVNSSSASASEIVASALQEQYGATIIGQKTYGKGTVQELQQLSNGDKYKLTTKNWLTSKGTWVDKKGIEPDIEVGLSQEYSKDPSDENDNQLQTALSKLVE